jgi:hypothetical protein
MSTVQAPIDRFLLPKELQELLEDRVKTYNNMAQVFSFSVITELLLPTTNVVGQCRQEFFSCFGEIFR